VPPFRFAAIRSRLGVRAPRIDSTRPETGREKTPGLLRDFSRPDVCTFVPFCSIFAQVRYDWKQRLCLSQPGAERGRRTPAQSAPQRQLLCGLQDRGPMICTLIGRPEAERSIGAKVAGRLGKSGDAGPLLVGHQNRCINHLETLGVKKPLVGWAAGSSSRTAPRQRLC
jgi:hypothetical protein